jgi:hypothetical protein
MIDNELNVLVNIPEEKINEDNLWRSCCLVTDKRMIVFFSQLIIGISVISFSFIQLARNDECESNQLYVGLVTMIIGIFLPSPRVK